MRRIATRRTSTSLIPLGLGLAYILAGCAPQQTIEPIPLPEPVPEKPKTVKPEPVPEPTNKVDSIGADPRPVVIIEKLGFAGVRTRLIPHVMGRGWALTVNKPDSIEFQRAAEPALAQAIFGIAPESGTKIRLRFRLTQTSTGAVKVESCSHLISSKGVQLPYRISAEILNESLTDLRKDLLAAPTGSGVVIDRVRKK